MGYDFATPVLELVPEELAFRAMKNRPAEVESPLGRLSPGWPGKDAL